MTQIFRETQQFHPDSGFRCTVGHLRSKGTKAKKVILRLTLKNTKIFMPIKTDVIRGRAYRSRSANVVYHLDSEKKLVRHNVFESGAVDGCGHRVMWLKFSNNNRGNTSRDLIKEAISTCITPLKVRGDKRSENLLISKHLVMLSNRLYRGCAGGRSTHNTRIESFWREHNASVMNCFRNNFERLEDLGQLDLDDNVDLWSLNCACMEPINQTLIN